MKTLEQLKQELYNLLYHSLGKSYYKRAITDQLTYERLKCLPRNLPVQIKQITNAIESKLSVKQMLKERNNIIMSIHYLYYSKGVESYKEAYEGINYN